ncbi:hypothetical protein [Halanaerobium sp. ST460_2HS_T2]|uniref:hypothetical protein n=1 Tax=Halanaerobium sp. ST460_2HS_T2 TaxID=2183914 RepID=UPI000DF26927|nr:hypothetical protein [Halanaerobium sp. ST460_2HS_T2]RCW58663.1 hypothetical protein DFR80_11085 [Halanaerobium sp. ST460_2HS_T2]
MQIKIGKLLKIIKKLKKEINSKLKTAKDKRAEVISKRRKLAEIEMNLRNMRATAVKIRDEDLTTLEKEELQEYFNYLKMKISN